MDLVRKLVYAQKDTELDAEHQQFKKSNDPNLHKWRDTESVEMTGQYSLEEVERCQYQ